MNHNIPSRPIDIDTMSIFRITHNNFETSFNGLKPDTLDVGEWEVGDVRAEEPSWIARYQYEASVIGNIISEKKHNTVLEIGAGCGKLNSYILPSVAHEIDYHLIDRAAAKVMFEKNGGKGSFFVKDLSLDLDLTDLHQKYDMVICNDVLEHLLAPANILRRVHSLMTPSSTFFVSIPNWRMAHQFIYRGLWDYDNLLYFMHIHSFKVDDIYPSPLQTPYYPKLDSEQTMPDELLQSWNFYLVCSLK